MRRKRPGNHVDGAEKRLGLAYDVQPLDVLEGLELGPDVVAVDDLDIARHRPHVGVPEVVHGVAKRVGRQPGVGVHGHDDGRLGTADSEIQRVGFSAVLLPEHRNVDPVMVPLQLLEALEGVIDGAVIHHDDLVIGIAKLQQRGNRRLDDLALVIGGKDDGDEWIGPLVLLPRQLALVQIAEPDQDEVPQNQDQQESHQGDDQCRHEEWSDHGRVAE